MSTENTTPAGCRINSKGHYVPEQMIPPIDLERDALVQTLVREARIVNENLRLFKACAFSDIYAFIALSFEQYNTKIGKNKGKGNVTLYDFSGKYKIQLAVSDRIAFDERLQAAEQLISDCISEWAEDSRDEIKLLVQSAFQVDREGKINTGKVLSLRRIAIKNEKWQSAMDAIGESLQVVDSTEYIRVYERIEGSNKYIPINLDLAAV